MVEGQAARSAVDGQPQVPTVSIGAGLGRRVEAELEIVGDKQIETAVAVIVEEGAAGVVAHAILNEARFARHIAKAFAAFVAIEHVLAPVSDEEIGIAVVVVIARADALRPAGASNSHLLGDVAVAAPAFVVVEARGRAVAAGHEDVEQAVVIVVEEAHAAAGGFDDVGLGFHAAVGRDAG